MSIRAIFSLYEGKAICLWNEDSPFSRLIS